MKFVLEAFDMLFTGMMNLLPHHSCSIGCTNRMCCNLVGMDSLLELMEADVRSERMGAGRLLDMWSRLT